MSRKNNHKPIIQITPAEYFSADKEYIPLWLANHKKGDKVNISELLNSRIVYYPGAGTDGSPIRTFNTAHATHVFVYVDYGYDKQKIDSELSDDAFVGYHLHHEQAVTRNELLPCAFHSHVSNEEMRFAASGYNMSIRPEDGFALLKIYERNEDYTDDHGAERFAILYIGADANLTYDVLFGNTDRSPYACVVCANMGSGCTCFVRDSLMERIAIRANRFPKYLLCIRGYGWEGYGMLKTVSNTRGDRYVWKKGHRNVTIDDLYEELTNYI
jgi:hypothetical protein